MDNNPNLSNSLKYGIPHFSFVILFSIFSNMLLLTGPLFMLQVYDRVLGSRSEETLGALFLLIAGLFILLAMLDFARGRVAARFGAFMQDYLDERVFRIVMTRSVLGGKHTSVPVGLRELESIQTFCASPILLAILDLPWTPLFIIGIFIFHPLLGWFAVFGGGILIAIAVVNQIVTHRMLGDAELVSAKATGFSDQARRSAALIRSQGMEPDIARRWRDMRQDALGKRIKSSDWLGMFAAVTKSTRMFLQSAILAVGAYLVLQDQVTGGAMIAASILLGRALAPIEQCISQWRQIQTTRKNYGFLRKLLSEAPPETPKTDLPAAKPVLEIKSLTMIPPDSRIQTLQQVSFAADAGDVIGVIGNSGAGKTTLAQALLGIWPPAAGEIRLGGALLDQYDRSVLGKSIGYLPQEVTLFSGTIAENIARMACEPDDRKIVEAAQKANAHELILSFPNGYDTVLTADNIGLSGGQKQRIGLARALYGDPVLLILDEPNSALDSQGSLALNAAVRSFQTEGKTTLIMTHRPTAIAECNKLLVLDKGRVKAFGPRDEVLKSVTQNAAEISRHIKPVQSS